MLVSGRHWKIVLHSKFKQTEIEWEINEPNTQKNGKAHRLRMMWIIAPSFRTHLINIRQIGLQNLIKSSVVRCCNHVLKIRRITKYEINRHLFSRIETYMKINDIFLCNWNHLNFKIVKLNALINLPAIPKNNEFRLYLPLLYIVYFKNQRRNKMNTSLCHARNEEQIQFFLLSLSFSHRLILFFQLQFCLLHVLLH